MSNRAVSDAYRTVIDDVIANVRQDFEDMGIEKEVLEELQRSWEHKVLASGVADFEGAPATFADNAKARKGDGAKKEAGEESNKKARKNGTEGVKEEGTPEASGSGSAAAAADGAASAAEASATASGTSSAAGESSSNGANKRKRPVSDSNEITSDLDDSDEEDLIAGNDGEAQDMMLCLYDRVQRVKNKWKVVLKDGVASIDGRDYLFSKCNGEFEW